MTRAEAIEAAPNSPGTYGSWLAGTGFMCIVFFVFSVLGIRKSGWLESIAVFITLVMIAAAVLCWERIFRPERAAERNASLSDKQRQWMKLARTTLIVCGSLLFAISMVLFCLSDRQLILSNDLRLLVFPLFGLAAIFADLLGERIGGVRQGSGTGANLLQGNLGPVRSEHWGERG